jgi:hypothetical protein
MILGWLRLLALSFVVLTVVYVLVSIYSRSVRRERLEETYDAGGVEGDRDAYIEAGMQAYKHGLRRKLIWLVYIIPLAVMTATVWWINWD